VRLAPPETCFPVDVVVVLEPHPVVSPTAVVCPRTTLEVTKLLTSPDKAAGTLNEEVDWAAHPECAHHGRG